MILKLLLCIATVFLHTNVVESKVKVHIFTKAGDQISDNTVSYFEKLKKEYSKYFDYEVYTVWDENWKEDKFNRKLVNKSAEHFNKEVLGAPYIIIGDKYVFDEYSEELHEEYKNAILSEYSNNNYVDLVEKLKKEVTGDITYDKALTVIILMGIPIIITVPVVIARKQNKKEANS